MDGSWSTLGTSFSEDKLYIVQMSLNATVERSVFVTLSVNKTSVEKDGLFHHTQLCLRAGPRRVGKEKIGVQNI